MFSRSLLSVGIAAAVLLLPSILQPAHAGQPQASLALVSEAGDPVGGGEAMTLAPQVVQGNAHGLVLSASAGGTRYTLKLAPAPGETLRPGSYENARGGAVASRAHPRLEFSGDRSCHAPVGRFHIDDIAFDASGRIERLRGQFEQHCDSAVPALWGDVAIGEEPMTFNAVLERFGTWGVPDSTAYLWVQCSGTGGYGRLRVTAEQPGPHGTVVRAGSSRNFGCGPDPYRVDLDLPAPAPHFRPGPVLVSVWAYVNPSGTDDGENPVVREVVRRVYLLPGYK